MPRARLPLTLVACAALAACAPAYGDAYLLATAAGLRAYHAGRYLDAASAYNDAAKRALRVTDRDEARLLSALSFERAERWPLAKAALQKLVADSPRGPCTPHAAFELAELEIQHGDAETGWRSLEQAAEQYPSHGLARVSLQRLLAHLEEQRGEAGVLAFLQQKTPAFEGTELDQTVHYEIARCLDRLGKTAEAHDALVATAHAHPYPSGSLTDDALIRAAEIDVAAGRAEEATRHLRAVVATREASRFMSSAERPRYADAQMRLAEIYRDTLKDHATARREFAKVCAEHPRSRLCDDAVWAEAKLARADGDGDGACRLAKKLVEELADSRYARCARLVCPTAPAGKRACADYIAREFEGHPPEAPE